MKTMSANRKVLIGSLSAIVVLTVTLVAILVMNGWNATPALAEQATQSASALPMAAQANPTSSTLPRTITVVGEGVVTIDPDVAQVNIGIDIVGDTVVAANEEANTILEAIFAALKAQGIADKDVQTAGYNIWIERPYGGFEGPAQSSIDDARYHVNNNVSVVIRNLETVGDVLNAAINAGANNINGVTFNLDNMSDVSSQARELAVADAEARAAELAGLNQVTLGEVVRVSEIVGNSFFPGAPYAQVGMGGGGGSIAPGQLEMRVQLEISYAIQ